MSIKLHLPPPSENDLDDLTEEVIYLGRQVTLSSWMCRCALIGFIWNVAILIAIFTLDRKIPLWVSIVGWVQGLIPLITMPFRDWIAENCKWIPQPDDFVDKAKEARRLLKEAQQDESPEV